MTQINQQQIDISQLPRYEDLRPAAEYPEGDGAILSIIVEEDFTKYVWVQKGKTVTETKEYQCLTKSVLGKNLGDMHGKGMFRCCIEQRKGPNGNYHTLTPGWL